MGHSLLGGLSRFPAGIEDVIAETMVELCAIGTDGGDGSFGHAFSALFQRLDLSGQRTQVVKGRTVIRGSSNRTPRVCCPVLAMRALFLPLMLDWKALAKTHIIDDLAHERGFAFGIAWHVVDVG